MRQPKKTYFNWSTGKDASLALYYLLQDASFSVELLITSINTHFDRVSMHGLRRELLEQQVLAVGLPLRTIELPEQPTMEEYNQQMEELVSDLKLKGFTDCAFGDIFLEDLRAYREKQLDAFNIKAHFPIWKKDTRSMISEFLSLGFKAVIITVNASLLDESFVGREIDEEFLNDLPEGVDPCGENGEFHTFCYDGPIFKTPINFVLREKVFREYKKPKDSDICDGNATMGFWFQDLELVGH